MLNTLETINSNKALTQQFDDFSKKYNDLIKARESQGWIGATASATLGYKSAADKADDALAASREELVAYFMPHPCTAGDTRTHFHISDYEELHRLKNEPGNESLKEPNTCPPRPIIPVPDNADANTVATLREENKRIRSSLDRNWRAFESDMSKRERREIDRLTASLGTAQTGAAAVASTCFLIVGVATGVGAVAAPGVVGMIGTGAVSGAALAAGTVGATSTYGVVHTALSSTDAKGQWCALARESNRLGNLHSDMALAAAHGAWQGAAFGVVAGGAGLAAAAKFGRAGQIGVAVGGQAVGIGLGTKGAIEAKREISKLEEQLETLRSQQRTVLSVPNCGKYFQIKAEADRLEGAIIAQKAALYGNLAIAAVGLAKGARDLRHMVNEPSIPQPPTAGIAEAPLTARGGKPVSVGGQFKVTSNSGNVYEGTYLGVTPDGSIAYRPAGSPPGSPPQYLRSARLNVGTIEAVSTPGPSASGSRTAAASEGARSTASTAPATGEPKPAGAPVAGAPVAPVAEPKRILVPKDAVPEAASRVDTALQSAGQGPEVTLVPRGPAQSPPPGSSQPTRVTATATAERPAPATTSRSAVPQQGRQTTPSVDSARRAYDAALARLRQHAESRASSGNAGKYDPELGRLTRELNIAKLGMKRATTEAIGQAIGLRPQEVVAGRKPLRFIGKDGKVYQGVIEAIDTSHTTDKKGLSFGDGAYIHLEGQKQPILIDSLDLSRTSVVGH